MGWNPLKKSWGINVFGRTGVIGKAYNQFVSMGERAGDKAGIETNTTKDRAANEAAQIAAARLAAHNAEVARLAVGALGTIALRRRRGSATTMLTGSSMGGNPTSTGKTLLSQ
jgi:hypothetical protein